MIHTGTKTIETSRLILRPFTPADAQPMYRNWASDSEVTKYLTWPTHGSPEVSQWVVNDWVSHYAEPSFYQWAIVPKDLDEPIGTISVVSYDDKTEKMEIGYCIGRPWWGRGIVTEAFRAVLDYLFEEVGASRIEAAHDVNNPASGAVMAKCGLHHEGTLRKYGWNNQGVCDICQYAILKEDWS